MANAKRSEIWMHFTPAENNKAKAKCDICRSLLSYKGGTTSNLKKHLQSKHPTILVAATRGNRTEDSVPNSSSVCADKTGSQETGELNVEPEKDGESLKSKYQSTLASFLERPTSVTRKKKLDNLLLNLILLDLQPFSIVDDKGFRAFVDELDKSYKLPSRATLTRLLPQRYQDCLETVKFKLSTVKYVCLTTDAWTSRATESYMAVTAHFIQDWKLESCLLDCFHMSVRHTAENIRNELIRVAQDFEITRKIVAVVTDNAANVVAAIRLTGWTHYPCLAHTINLLVRKALEIVAEIQQKIKMVVEHFHRSTVASQKFRSMQLQLKPGSEVLN